MIPIRDGDVPDGRQAREMRARRELYLKVKLGRWLAQLPITVRLLSSAIVNYVRTVERYTAPQRLVSGLRLAMNLVLLAFRLETSVCFRPAFFPEHRFRGRAKPSQDDFGFLALVRLLVMRLNLLGVTTAGVGVVVLGLLVTLVLTLPVSTMWEEI